MTEEYRKFKEHQNMACPDFDGISVQDYLAHWGVNGMKWGVVNEKEDVKPNKKREEVMNKVKSFFGK